MATNNLDPIGTHLPANHPTPTPAPSGMSVLAKLVIGIAALFFTAFLYVAFSGSGKPSTMPPVRKEDQLDERQRQEIERISPKLLGYFDKVVPPQYEAEFQRLATVFTGDCPITAHDIEAANLLLAELSSPASVGSSVMGRPLGDPLITEQNRELEEALRADQQRPRRETEEERAALLARQRREQEEALLQEKRWTIGSTHTGLIQEFTKMDFEWLQTLSPFVMPIHEFKRISVNYTEAQLRHEGQIVKIFDAKKGSENLPLNREIRDRDVEIDRRFKVEEFNKTYPDGEFAGQRASLEEAYRCYHERVIEALGCYKIWLELFCESQQNSPNLDVFLKHVTPKSD